MKRQEKATYGSWYKVCYIKNSGLYGDQHMLYRNEDILLYSKVETFRLDNMNGYGIGTLFFNNIDDRLVVLPWSAIISMIPIDEPKEYNNKNNKVKNNDDNTEENNNV